MEFLTIGATSKKYGFPEHMLRDMQKRNELPGWFSGTRYYINVPMLMEQLNAESRKHMSSAVDENHAS